MKRVGVIAMTTASRCLLRRRSAVVRLSDCGTVKHINRTHSFCTSANSISQIEQSTIIESPFVLEYSEDEDESPPFYLPSEVGVEKKGFSEMEWSLDENRLHRPGAFFRRSSGLVSHLIQVFSLSLHTNFDDYGDDRPCQVHGLVYTTNPQQFNLNLYTRTLTNPDTIPNNSILSLMEGRGNIVTYGHASNTILNLDLNDRSRNTAVIKKKHNLHSITEEIEDSSNKLLKDIVHGEHGCVVVYYTKFMFAIYVAIEVAIFSKRKPDSPFLRVYGDIVAGYSNAREYCNNDDEVRHMKCTLFSKPFDNLQLVENGRPMKLSSFGVALPVYGSSLIIDANVSDAYGQLVHCSIEFPWPGRSKKLIDDKFGTIIVIVKQIVPNGVSYSEAEDDSEDEEVVS